MSRRPQTSLSRAMCALATVALALGACSSGPAPSAAPTPAPSAPAPSTPAVAPSAAAASVPASARPIAIPDGTYATAPRSTADIRAELAASGELSEAEQAMLLDENFEFGDHETFVVSITLEDGEWIQRQGLDDEPLNIGSRATYAFPNNSTVVINEPCCGISTFYVAMDGDTFRLTYLGAENLPKVDRAAGHILFETAAFTLVR